MDHLVADIERRELMLWYKAVISRSRLNSRSTETRGTVGAVVERWFRRLLSRRFDSLFNSLVFDGLPDLMQFPSRVLQCFVYFAHSISFWPRDAGGSSTFSAVSQRERACPAFSPRNEES